MFIWTLVAMGIACLFAIILTIRVMQISFGKPPTRGKKAPSASVKSANAYEEEDTETIETETDGDNENKPVGRHTEMVTQNS